MHGPNCVQEARSLEGSIKEIFHRTLRQLRLEETMTRGKLFDNNYIKLTSFVIIWIEMAEKLAETYIPHSQMPKIIMVSFLLKMFFKMIFENFYPDN